MAETVTQLAVFLKNVPGALHQMLRALAEAELNVEGIMVNDAADHAVVRMVVDSPQRAIHVLGDHGAVVVDGEVISYPLADRPGEIQGLAGTLAEAGINIAYIYGSTPLEGGRPRLFIHTSDDAKVLALLGAGSGDGSESRSGRRGAPAAAAPGGGPPQAAPGGRGQSARGRRRGRGR